MILFRISLLISWFNNSNVKLNFRYFYSKNSLYQITHFFCEICDILYLLLRFIRILQYIKMTFSKKKFFYDSCKNKSNEFGKWQQRHSYKQSQPRANIWEEIIRCVHSHLSDLSDAFRAKFDGELWFQFISITDKNDTPASSPNHEPTSEKKLSEVYTGISVTVVTRFDLYSTLKTERSPYTRSSSSYMCFVIILLSNVISRQGNGQRDKRTPRSL